MHPLIACLFRCTLDSFASTCIGGHIQVDFALGANIAQQDSLTLPTSSQNMRTEVHDHEGGRSLSLEEHFLRYRKHELDQMTLDFFHPHRNQRFASRCTGFVRKLVPSSTPTRFALHRRFSSANTEWWMLKKPISWTRRRWTSSTVLPTSLLQLL